MKYEPLVSIIIPTFNGSAYLRRCIDSIARQTYKNIEVVLIDDGSSPDEHQFIQNLISHYSNIVLLVQKNSGQGVARNNGLKIAKGEWILFVDSDDSLGERFVEHLVRAAMNNVDVVCCNYTIILRGKHIPIILNDHERISESSSELFQTYLLRNIAPAPWCKLIRKSIIDGIVFPPFRAREDEFFNLQLFSKVASAAFICEAGYFRYIRANSTERSIMSFRKMATIASCFWAEQQGAFLFPELTAFCKGYCLRSYYYLLKEHFSEKSELTDNAISFIRAGITKYRAFVEFINDAEKSEIKKYLRHPKRTVFKWKTIRVLKIFKRRLFKD